MALNDNQNSKPYSPAHISNLGFDPEFQMPMQEGLLYNPANATIQATLDRPLTPDLTMRIDDTSTSNVTYIGKARVGTPTSDAYWQIKKIDNSSGVIITWCDGNLEFDNVWDDRTSLTYS
jgi:hypothetical protein